jgi:prepilin-type N-terminal cleavage/methylation domain-containing protein
MKKGFTLIEMLVVIGIIAVLVGASIGGFSAMTRTAEKAKCQELVSNVATALTVMFQQEGAWPRVLAQNGASDGRLDAKTAYALVAKGRTYLSLSHSGNKLTGNDRFGVVSPWAATLLKRKGNAASLSDVVSVSPQGGQMTVQDHILHYALDMDGDGIIQGASVGNQVIDVRATAIVWCGGKDGFVVPYPYAEGGGRANSGKNDDVYSWTPGQTKGVK